MLISLSLIVAAASQIEIPGGKCIPVPLMPDFDLNKYGGVWYEQIRYPFRSAGPDDKCVIATYKGIDDTSISVNNTVIRPDKNGLLYQSSVIGTGVQTEPEVSGNKLYVDFRIIQRYNTEANYNVLDTDYENYAILSPECQDMGSYTIEMFWILSRSQDFRKTEMYEEVVQKAVEEYGFIREEARETPQEDCRYDYSQNDAQLNNLSRYSVAFFSLLIIICYKITQF